MSMDYLHDAAKGHQGAVRNEEPLGHSGPDDLVDVGRFHQKPQGVRGKAEYQLGSSAVAVAVRGVALRAEISPTCSPGPAVRVTRKRPPSSRTTPRSAQDKEGRSRFLLAQESVPRRNLQDFRHRQNPLAGLARHRRHFGRLRDNSAKSSGVAARRWDRSENGPAAPGNPAPGAEEEVTRRTTCMARMISAGPAVNAEARKRGPTMDEFQKGRPPRPT